MSKETALRNDLKQVLTSPNKCPMACQFAWHASATFNKQTGSGGTSGATMRFEPEFSDVHNAFTRGMIPVLEPLKSKYPGTSLADIWAFTGAVSVEAAGGPQIPCQFGRADVVESRPPSGCCKKRRKPTYSMHGRPAAIPPNGLLPDPRKSDELRSVFGRMGFNDREIVALSGGHTLGRCRKNISGFEGPWTHDEKIFNNAYFKNLIELEWVPRTDGSMQWDDKKTRTLCMIPTDIALIQDPQFRQYVKMYAEDEATFFRDFASAYSKLLHLGTGLTPAPLPHAPSPQAPQVWGVPLAADGSPARDGKGQGKGKTRLLANTSRFQINLGKGWQDYDPAEDKILKRAFMAGFPFANLELRGQRYQYDFKRMVQINAQTGKEREIRPPMRKGTGGKEVKWSAPPKPLVPPGKTTVVTLPPGSPGTTINVPYPGKEGKFIPVNVPPTAKPGQAMLVPLPPESSVSEAPAPSTYGGSSGYSTGTKVAYGGAALAGVAGAAVGGVILGGHIAEHGLDATVDAAGDGLADLGEGFGDGVIDAGEFAVDAGEDVGGFIMDLF